MKKILYGLMALYLFMCSPEISFAVVEHDNVLKGVLKDAGYSVIQDIHRMTAVKPGGAPLVFFDVDTHLYELATRINTVFYAEEYKTALQKYADEFELTHKGMTADLSADADFIEFVRPFDALMIDDAYKKMLQFWEQRMTAVKKELKTLMKTASKDGVSKGAVRKPPKKRIKTDPEGKPAYFTRGSHEDLVLILQGTPDRITGIGDEERWFFGYSKVVISTSDRRVKSWNNEGNLKVKLLPGK